MTEYSLTYYTGGGHTTIRGSIDYLMRIGADLITHNDINTLSIIALEYDNGGKIKIARVVKHITKQ